MNKGIVLGIAFLFVLMSFTSISGIQIDKNIILSSARGNILYVGGTGEGNYSTIQGAINDANSGDTVFVFDDSSPYQEGTLKIIESINLIGENRDTTIIDGEISNIDGSPNTMLLIDITYTNWVNISGFTFLNSEFIGISTEDCDYINISGNIFIDVGIASIAISESNYSYISDNIFTSTKADDLDKRGGVALDEVFF
jgi:parallel beta-helix repeat protein